MRANSFKDMDSENFYFGREDYWPEAERTGESIMQIKERKVKDLPVWPPMWTCRSLGVNDGVLKNVEIISGTGCVKIDVERGNKNHVGVILTGGDDLDTLFHRLKENIGRPLAEIENLEVKF